MNLELVQKFEEIKHLNAYKEQFLMQLSSQKLTRDLEKELKLREKS